MLWAVAEIVLFTLLVIFLVFYFITHILDFAESVREYRRYKKELRRLKNEVKEEMDNIREEFPNFVKLVSLYCNLIVERQTMVLEEYKELRERYVRILACIQEVIDYYDSHKEIEEEVWHIEGFKILAEKIKEDSKNMKESFEKEIEEMDRNICRIESEIT